MIPPDPFGRISAYARFWLLVYCVLCWLVGAGYYVSAPRAASVVVAALAPITVPILVGATLARG